MVACYSLLLLLTEIFIGKSLMKAMYCRQKLGFAAPFCLPFCIVAQLLHNMCVVHAAQPAGLPQHTPWPDPGQKSTLAKQQQQQTAILLMQS
jgi:hypothetical protein